MSGFVHQNRTFYLFIITIIPIFVPSKNQIMTNQEIHDICKKYGIQNYTINPDGSIDVNGNVELVFLTKNNEEIRVRYVPRIFGQTARR